MADMNNGKLKTKGWQPKGDSIDRSKPPINSDLDKKTEVVSYHFKGQRQQVSIARIGLQRFIQQCERHIENVDLIMKQKESFERGEKLAKEMNAFDNCFSYFLHFVCNIPFDKINTIKNKTFDIRRFIGEKGK